jgi:predicted ATPase
VESAFVGRTAELEAIAEVLLTATRERHAAAVAIIGAPGLGKSQLLHEARARHRNRSSLAIAGYEPEMRVPLSAAADLLTELGTGLQRD